MHDLAGTWELNMRLEGASDKQSNYTNDFAYSLSSLVSLPLVDISIMCLFSC